MTDLVAVLWTFGQSSHCRHLKGRCSEPAKVIVSQLLSGTPPHVVYSQALCRLVFYIIANNLEMGWSARVTAFLRKPAASASLNV